MLLTNFTLDPSGGWAVAITSTPDDGEPLTVTLPVFGWGVGRDTCRVVPVVLHAGTPRTPDQVYEEDPRFGLSGRVTWSVLERR